MAFSGFDSAIVDEVTGEQIDYSPEDAEPASLPIAPAMPKAKAVVNRAASCQPGIHNVPASGTSAFPSILSELLGPLKLAESLLVPFLSALGADLDSDVGTFSLLDPADLDTAFADMANDGLALTPF